MLNGDFECDQGGQRINQVQTETDTVVEVDKQLGQVRVCGTEEAVSKAKVGQGTVN